MRVLKSIAHELYSVHRSGMDQIDNLFIWDNPNILNILALGVLFVPTAYLSGNARYLIGKAENLTRKLSSRNSEY